MSAAPIHYDGRRHDVAGMTALVAEVRASVVRATAAAFDDLAAALPEPVESMRPPEARTNTTPGASLT